MRPTKRPRLATPPRKPRRRRKPTDDMELTDIKVRTSEVEDLRRQVSFLAERLQVMENRLAIINELSKKPL